MEEAVVVPRAGPLVVVDRAGNSLVVLAVGIVLRLEFRQRRRW